MLDLETLGTQPGSVILSIGAVRFDRTGIDVAGKFYQTIKIQSCLDAGLTVDGDTIKWWLKQSEEARREIYDAKQSELTNILTLFTFWCGKSEYVWGNGAAFDNALLRSAYAAVKLSPPWESWNDMCFRTVRAENPHIEPPEFKGVKHHPVDDARHQAEHLIKIWNG